MRGPVGIWTRNTPMQQTQMEGKTDKEGRIKMWFERGQAEAREGRHGTRAEGSGRTTQSINIGLTCPYWNIRTLSNQITGHYMPCALGEGK